MLRWTGSLLSCNNLLVNIGHCAFRIAHLTKLDAGCVTKVQAPAELRAESVSCRAKMRPDPGKARMSPKKFASVPTVILALAVLAITSFALTRHSQLFSQTPASASQTQEKATPAPETTTATPSTQQLPPGTISYTAKAYTTAQFLARNHLTESKYMTVAEYVDAIAKANNGKTTFKRGETALIPGIEPQPIVEKSRPWPKDAEIRAIYLTGTTAGSAKGIELVRHWKEAGGNAVVFDIKDSDGTINVPFQHPLARKIGRAHV